VRLKKTFYTEKNRAFTAPSAEMAKQAGIKRVEY
jgi:hypothetical protein